MLIGCVSYPSTLISMDLFSHAFQHKRYISIARTENIIMYALGPFSRIPVVHL